MLRLPHTTFLVDDYDDAISYFTNTLEFTLVDDTPLSDSKRWVIVESGRQAGRLLLSGLACAFQPATCASFNHSLQRA